MFSAYRATEYEIQQPLPGDAVIPQADLVVNSAMTFDSNPEDVWPWVVQLGKGRAGWYLPDWVPDRFQGYRSIDPSLQNPAVGDKIGDWVASELEIVEVDPPKALISVSEFRGIRFSWALVLESIPVKSPKNGTRLLSRTRLAPIEHVRTAAVAGGFVDRMVAAGLVKGLKSRLGES